MAWRRVLLRLAAPLLMVAACGGGRSGTGISETVGDLVAGDTPVATDPAADPVTGGTTAPAEDVLSIVNGNVAYLRSAAVVPGSTRTLAPSLFASVGAFFRLTSIAHAGGGLAGILVTAQGSGDGTETDPDGFFSLDGAFSGPLAIRFERAEDGIGSIMEVSVPKGGSLFLHDVALDGSTGVASAETQDIAFDGVVTGKSCRERRLRTASRFEERGSTFTIDLATSVLRDSSGTRIGCLELDDGDAVRVTGAVQPGGIIGDGDVVVEQGANGAEVTATTISSVPQLSPPLPSDVMPLE
ncbi:MAG: hypothetical protein ACREQQ_17960 [Candidatus Binatia bacterium]